MNDGVKEPEFEADPGAFRRDECRPLCHRGAREGPCVFFSRTSLRSASRHMSHKQTLLLKGESECKSCMNAVVAWMSTRKPS